jgi:hypothetical protein
MANPKCFISYSWESPQHKDWVRNLAECLQRNGVITLFDQWDVRPGVYLTEYMETSIRESDYVLLVCTPIFAQKANGGIGGVGYEKNIVTGEIFTRTAPSTKFVPILRFGDESTSLPSYLKSKVFIDFRNDSKFDESLQILLRHLHDIPEFTRPPLGTPSLTVNPSTSRNIVQPNGQRSAFDLSTHKQLVDYANSFSGLNLSKQAAAEWADQHSHMSTEDLTRYKQLVDYANSFSGLNLSKQAAAKWADQHSHMSAEDLTRYKQLVDYANSFSGLNLSKQAAAEWADQHFTGL